VGHAEAENVGLLDQVTGDGWIFVSHSNLDIDAVYKVRNELESRRHHPLLFFLRCLSDTDELDDLIAREIQARDFFLYCDSPNARASSWVQRELAFIRALPNRVVETVDLTADPTSQSASLGVLSRAQTLFLSYAHADHRFVDIVRDELLNAGYRVWDPATALGVGGSVISEIEGGIREALRHGFFLWFVSEKALTSRWVGRELELAREILRDAPREAYGIVPIIVRDGGALAQPLPEPLGDLMPLVVAAFEPHDAARHIINYLRERA
jgi:TIR domain